MAAQVSKACIDRGGSDSCARRDQANCDGIRAGDYFRKGRARPCSRVLVVSAASGREPLMQWLKGISSRILLQEFPSLRKKFWGRHFWARGYLAVSSGTITDEMIKEYIDEQEGEQIADDSRFLIDNT